MTLQWFMARTWGDKISPVELQKATEKTVTLMNGRREGRYSTYSSYHPTFEEAKDYLVKLAERGVESARLSLQKAQGHLGNCRGLRAPDNGSAL